MTKETEMTGGTTALQAPPRARTRSSGRSAHALTERLGDSPWRRRDAVRLALFLGLGVVGLAVAWIGCSGETDFRRQLWWIVLAVVAVVVSAVGSCGWLLTALGAVARARGEVRGAIRELYAAGQPAPAAPYRADVNGAVGFVTAEGMRRYHTPQCDVVRGKQTRPARVAGRGAEDLKPCGMCLP